MPAIVGNIPTTGQDVREKLGELSPLVLASFLVQASNAAITTMIAIVIAQHGGEQSDVSLIAACYALGFMLGCFVAPALVLTLVMLPPIEEFIGSWRLAFRMRHHTDKDCGYDLFPYRTVIE